MITPLLIHKERLVKLWLHTPLSSYTSKGLLEAIAEIDKLVERQQEHDRAHREEVKALIGIRDSDESDLGVYATACQEKAASVLRKRRV